jgi:hypothetical protein
MDTYGMVFFVSKARSQKSEVRSQNLEKKCTQNMKPQETKRQPAKSFQDLIVWQKAHQFVLAIYKLSNSFPKSEIYGLTSQIRRASVSVSANIAESF